MRFINAFVAYLTTAAFVVAAPHRDCKCTPDEPCWPRPDEWKSLNSTLGGRLIRSVPPASVCYKNQPNYNEAQCEFVRSQWYNSIWHAENPISIDYPVWANNSCNPIFPNGTSVNGAPDAGKNGCSIGNYPVYVVNATTAEHVSAAFKWAGKKNVRVVIKSTGHSFPGRSTGYGSLSIWTHNFRGIEYLPSFKPTSCPINGTLMAARVAAGTTGIEALAALAPRKAIVVTGNNAGVGIVGWLTGGGHGPLSSTYGMGADNLLEATIVTPDGKALVANPCKNTDVFFAIRGGGGGTFGVVTEVVIKAYPSPKSTIHTFLIGAINPATTKEWWDLVGYLHVEMARLKEGGMQGYYSLAAPPGAPTLYMSWGFYAYDKPDGAVEKLVKPITDYVDQRAAYFIYQSQIKTAPTYWDLYGPTGGQEAVAKASSAYGSRLMTAESLSNPNVTAKVLGEIDTSANNTYPYGIYTSPVLLGNMAAAASPPSYYPDVISMQPAWRRSLLHLIIAQGWNETLSPSPEAIKGVYEDTTKRTEPLRKLSPDTGAYFNEADSYEPDWQNAFWGPNYKKLRKIKENLDPKGTLWCRRCVGSENWVEQQNGGLCRA
ncbi:hypothetical protein BCR34DRAFT_594304 [Clohesyomyces aquaticus]|uniref:FAD-binding PCMH-type domain-containing protein n=1 Tax=Clohesyomyces aquaticus TaxID=1231657 RepID=A0A1Y1YB90_9PLEO|nr:hypothetical protein BCR34DRAFT_594304 [Clohesyomyces aquaticus]